MDVCGSSRDHQEHISTDIFVHCFSRFRFWFQIVFVVVLARPKWCKNTFPSGCFRIAGTAV